MKRLECLDGMRGVLAVYVMLGHMAPFAALPPRLELALSHGGAAVDIFFILSGLVIVRSLESCRFEARPFLISRCARIFPVYLLMLAAGIAVQPLPGSLDALPWIGSENLASGIWSQDWPHNWGIEIAAHLTMTHGLFPNCVLPDVWVSFLGSAWSLSTEWQFYVMALVLGRIRGGTGRLAIVFFALALAGLAWDATTPDAWRFSRAFLPNKAQYFALGIASAALVDRRQILGFAVMLAAVLVVCFAQGGAQKLLPPVAWSLCLAAQLCPGSLALLRRPLRWRVVQWLGALSYPIYLANEPIQKALGFVLARFADGDGALFTIIWVPAALLIPIGVAVLLHRYVEQPAHRWGREIAHRGTVHADTAETLTAARP
jgi:peptidoglycan/LPS O-acetylase OafA/YrhL